MKRAILIAVLAALLLPAAASAWRDDGDTRSLLLALDRQERYLAAHGAATLRLDSRRVPLADAVRTVRELRALVLAHHGKPTFAAELDRRFEIVTVSDHALVTAYHSPLLRVSDARAAAYAVPILGRPPDLVASGASWRRRVGDSLVAPPTRAEIAAGAYDAARLAVAWTDDPVAYYYAQIQGSAIALFPDGRRRTLLYDGNNGHDYVSVEAQIIADVPADQRPGGYLGLRRYLHAHPDFAAPYFLRNPRFIFFRLSDRPPYGLADLPLTARRSIATDKAYYSAGLIALLDYPEPGRDGTARRVQTLVADADTGAAIKGPDRVDVYFGEGSMEDLFAAGLKDRGTLAYLLAKETAD